MDFALQYLKHGKALCGAVFGSFVETFNRLVDFYVNLKGDAEVSSEGCISIDRTDPAHPVIRLNRAKVGATSGGNSLPGAFELTEADDSSGYLLTNCFWNVGGRSYGHDDIQYAFPAGSCYLYAKFSLTAMGVVEIGAVGSVPELAEPQSAYDSYIVPLYHISTNTDSNGNTARTVVDLRNAPQIQAFETDLSFDSSS